MFIELFFVATLDMSMPEFQPQEDISGNVIVSEVDVSSGEFIAEEVPLNEIPIERTSDLPLLGLSQEEDWTEEFFTRSVDGQLLDNNVMNGKFINYVNGQNVIINSTSYYSIYYVKLIANNDYYVESNSYCYYSFSLDENSICYRINGDFTPLENCYAICQTTNTFSVYLVNNNSGGDVSGDEPGGDVSGDEPGGDVSGNGGSINVDLTNIESKLDNVIVLQRSILMTLLVTFLFPIIKSCVNLLKGGKDV